MFSVGKGKDEKEVRAIKPQIDTCDIIVAYHSEAYNDFKLTISIISNLQDSCRKKSIDSLI